MSKYVVTGGAGFIGSTIVDRLIDHQHDVIVLDNLSTGKKVNINNKANFINCDLSLIDQKTLNSYLKNTEIVFHCAALPNVQYSIEYPMEASCANVNTTIKILEAMKFNSIQKIIYSSSSSVYGDAISVPTSEQSTINPLSPYALQKYIGEKYCYLYKNMYNINYTILRYFNVYGERMTDVGAYVSVLSHFLRALIQNKTLNIVNDGNQKRDFVYVQDVVNANICSISETSNNMVFNIGSGINYTINTIADWFGIDKSYGETRIEPKETLADITKANIILEWMPKQSLEDWVMKMVYLHKKGETYEQKY
jgi:UDP-glucose 4-epimerase